MNDATRDSIYAGILASFVLAGAAMSVIGCWQWFGAPCGIVLGGFVALVFVVLLQRGGRAAS